MDICYAVSERSRRDRHGALACLSHLLARKCLKIVRDLILVPKFRGLSASPTECAEMIQRPLAVNVHGCETE